VIEIREISLFLGKEKEPLHIKDVTLKNGLWALVGRNGSGKSTFLSKLVDIQNSAEQNIKINSKRIQDYKQNDLAKTIAVVLSKVDVFGKLNGEDVLKLGRIPYQNIFGTHSQKDLEKVNEVIELLSLQETSKKDIQVLSDGEKQLLMIGRALVQDTPILLLDEPTAFLDVVNRKKIVSILNEISKSKLVLFSTHNIDLIETYCSGLLMIKDNQMMQVDDKVEFKNELTKLFENEI
jgi:iron complex transport system ATP-binding protein